jgi:hypothetical protein
MHSSCKILVTIVQLCYEVKKLQNRWKLFLPPWTFSNVDILFLCQSCVSQIHN